jgi:hypothetical protein
MRTSETPVRGLERKVSAEQTLREQHGEDLDAFGGSRY